MDKHFCLKLKEMGKTKVKNFIQPIQGVHIYSIDSICQQQELSIEWLEKYEQKATFLCGRSRDNLSDIKTENDLKDVGRYLAKIDHPSKEINSIHLVSVPKLNIEIRILRLINHVCLSYYCIQWPSG